MSDMHEPRFVDYYALLGVDTAASSDAIRRNYLQRAKEAHPDAGGSTVAMQLLNRAYKTLANSTSRAAYDLMHSIHMGRSEMQGYRYVTAPEPGDDIGDDDYIDMFLDQIYKEYSGQKKKQTPKDIFSKFFNK
jgi:curved DNA-binding protein CbpA